uniref:Protein kinase domain-containing protein n=1 Tax=Oryza rufipogon TaxID=4529 RepID=A0A0E0P516_ORYRU
MARTQVLLLVVFLLACLLDAPHLTSAAETDPTSPISFNFDFSKKYRGEDLGLEGSADPKVNKGFVDLTCSSSKTDFSKCKPGQMSYNHSSVPLWDRTTNELASFATKFTFKIVLSDYKNKSKGDGMAFFLANYPSRLPENSGGYALGLMNGAFPIAYDTDWFIPVEFDTSAPVQVSAKLPNPRTLLPPEVAVGFSTSTGSAFELHQILSWSFNSTLAAPLVQKGKLEPCHSVAFSIHFSIIPEELVAPCRLLPTTPPQQQANGMRWRRRSSPSRCPAGGIGRFVPGQVLAAGKSSRRRSSRRRSSVVGKELGGGEEAWRRPRSSAATKELAAKELSGRELGGRDLSGGTAARRRGIIIERVEVEARGDPCHSKAIAIGFSIGGGLILVLLLWSILSWWKWRKTNREFDKGTRGACRFNYHHLAAATNHFSMDNKIGAGAFGEVHKGFLTQLGREVADFFDEVQTISRAKQKNLVELLGWGMKGSSNIIDFMCWRRQKNTDLFLVYEFVDNGNLHMHLYEKEALLPWRIR